MINDDNFEPIIRFIVVLVVINQVNNG